MSVTKTRIVYLDALRAVASFFVVLLHTTALNTYVVDFQSPEWNIFMYYESVVNWAVPVFIMISGALMLSKDYTYSRIIKKIMRIAVLFAVWSLFYLLLDVWNHGSGTYRDHYLWLQVLMQGHYHMWFLLMLCGLYLLTPLLRAMLKEENSSIVFVILTLVFVFLIPSLDDLLVNNSQILQNPIVASIYRAIKNILEDMHLNIPVCYLSYYVFGYLIARKSGAISNLSNLKCRITGWGAICLGTAIVVFEIIQCRTKEQALLFIQHYQAGIFLQSAGIMLLFRNLNGYIIRAFAQISRISLGVYLIHPAIIEMFHHYGISSLSFSPWISVPVLASVFFAIAGLITYGMLRIRYIKAIVSLK